MLVPLIAAIAEICVLRKPALDVKKCKYQSVLMRIVLCSTKTFHLGNMLPAGISTNLEEPLLFMEF